MAVEERFDRAGLGLLERREGGPAFQEVLRQAGGQILAAQFDRLRKGLLQTGQRPLNMAGARVHRFAPVFDQAGQQARRLGVRVERFELVEMLGEDFQNLVGIQRVALGAAGFEGLAELGHRRGVERVEDQEVVGQQRMNQRAARLLQGHGDGLAAEAFQQAGHPRADDFGFLFQGAGFFFALPRDLQAEGMFLIGPIDRQEGGEVGDEVFGRVRGGGIHSV